MDGLRLSRQELKRTFGVSERLAVRVGALRSKGLLVTEALLEEVAGNGDLAKLLLSPELLEKAGGLGNSHSDSDVGPSCLCSAVSLLIRSEKKNPK